MSTPVTCTRCNESYNLVVGHICAGHPGMMPLDTMAALLDLCIAKRVKGCTVAGHEFVFDLPPLPGKEREPDAPPEEGKMPTRAEIEATRKRLADANKSPF